MKPFILVLYLCTALVWPSLWITKRGIRFFAILAIGAVLSSCTSTSGKFERSPCACSFRPVKIGGHGGKEDA